MPGTLNISCKKTLLRFALIFTILVSLNWYSIAQAPIISSVTPGIAIPGSTITISGSNFDPTPANNVVFFGATRASVTSAATGLLTVKMDTGATYAPVSVLNLTTNLAGYQQYAFTPTFYNGYFIPGLLSFKSRVDFTAGGLGANPYIAVIGDVDGDGKPDLVVNCRNTNRVLVYLNTSTPGSINSTSFAAPVNLTTTGGPSNVKLADIDGDGLLDIITANSSGAKIAIMRNSSTPGSINFTSAVDFSILPVIGSKVLAIADFDGDGKPDIAVTASDSNKVMIFRNTSTPGSISTGSLAPPVGFYTGIYPVGICAADFNGDGKIDVAVTDTLSHTVSVFRNLITSSGSIDLSSFAARDSFMTGTTPVDIAAADIDGDGKPDLLVTNSYSNTLSVFRDTGTIATAVGFDSRFDFATGVGPTGVAAGDLDGDGKVDVAVVNARDGTVSLFRNTATLGSIGATSLAIPVSCPLSTTAYSFGITIGDLDGDGYPDIVTGNNYPGTISILRNYPLPKVGPITGGTAPICFTGGTSSVNDTSLGGFWSLSSSSLATITITGSGSATITAMAPGVDTVRYSIIAGGDTNTAILPVVIDSLPVVAGITGPFGVCLGNDITLSDATATGSWSSSSSSIASVSSTGLVHGAAAGSATITYTFSNVCGSTFTIRAITVNTLPESGAITGPASVCAGGATITLSDTVAGGSWTSSSTGTATVNSSTGVITGVSAGSVTVTYTVNDGCGSVFTTTAIAVNPLPSAGTITGTTTLCATISTPLTDTSSGGVWSSSDTATAAVNSSGMLTGIGAGSATVSYTVTNGCGTAHTTAAISVNPQPVAGSITGAPGVCTLGATTTLGESVAFGTWSSSNPLIATVSSVGAATSIAYGTDTISYAVTNSCGTAYARTLFFVSSNPPVAGPITGTTTVCEASVTTLSDTLAGSSWSSSATSIATVNPTGIVTGVAGGSTIITYRVTNGCGTDSTTATVTVNPLPQPGVITGLSAVCAGGAIITLSDTAAAGVWSSSTTARATVNSTTGVVTGISPGTDTVFYAKSNGCGTRSASTIVTINPLPYAGTITGFSSVCQGSLITLSDTTTGGTWASVFTGTATISASGVITGVSAGTDTINYSYMNSCGTAVAKYVITVKPLPHAGAITGATSVCPGVIITLSDATGDAGGSWTSSNTARATVAMGVVTGVTPGAVTITYTASTATCGSAFTIYPITVSPTPAGGAITGPTTVCAGALITLADATGTSGGSWSSSATGTATAGVSSGVVTGVASGLVTITYTGTTVCGSATATYAVTVNPLPHAGAITGTSSVCPGSIITLTDTGGDAGGTWTSSTTARATVGSSSGVVTGVSSGAVTITYTANTISCGSVYTTYPITVSPAPAGGTITGPSVVCAGSLITLIDATGTPGGTWSSSSTGNATVNTSTGVVTGVAAGTTIITYTGTTVCGSAFAIYNVTVNPLPISGTITGTPIVCAGGAITTLTDTSAGGVWHSATTSIATVTSSGMVTGVASGSDLISYSVTNSCGTAITSITVTVSPLPYSGFITGTPVVCASGGITTLSDTAFGSSGSWSSLNIPAATVGSTGIVTGVAAGSAVIVYTVGNSCGTATTSITVTVHPLPAAGTITGAMSVCQGSSTTLHDATGAGIWHSDNTAIATISGTGVVSGLATGTANITYTVTTGCGSAATSVLFTVNALPNSGTITGAFNVCAGSAITVYDDGDPGTWSSSNASLATINSSGMITGVSAGALTISYTVVNGCGTSHSTQSFTVNPLPVSGIITGLASVCPGAVITLTDTATGGSWGSMNANASVTGGVVTGHITGQDTINYTVINSCGTSVANKVITVNPIPDTGHITGPAGVCAGSSIALSDTATGGSWNSSNPLAGTVNPAGIVTGVSAGNTVISYTFTNMCGTFAATHNVMVNPIPSLTGSLFDTLCDNAPFHDSLISTVTGTTFTWTRNAVPGIINAAGSGTTAINENLHDTTFFPVGVTYVVSMNAAGCANVQDIHLLVRPTPALDGVLADTICSGSAFDYIASSITPGTVFTWSRAAVAGITPSTATGSGSIHETLTNATLNALSTVYQFYVSANGCTLSQNVTLTLDPQAPRPAITTSSPSYVCSNTLCQNFGASQQPPAGVEYIWSAQGGAQVWATGSDKQYCLVSFYTAGMAWVYLNSIIPGYQCNTRDSFSVSVGSSISEMPEVIYFNADLVCIQNDVDLYQWGYDDRATLDSTILNGETNQHYHNASPDFANKYYWVITNHDGCMQKSYYNAPTAIQNMNEVNTGVAKIVPNPNPNQGTFTLTLPSVNNEVAHVVISNLLGEKVKELDVATNADINVSIDASNGIYLLSAATKNSRYTARIIVTR